MTSASTAAAPPRLAATLRLATLLSFVAAATARNCTKSDLLPDPTYEPGGAWSDTLLHDFKVPVWRLSWSVMGNVLAVSDANNLVTVWKESVDGRWDQISAAE